MHDWKYRHEAVEKGRWWKMREWKKSARCHGVENAEVEVMAQ